jgi:hypothetical protein
MSERIEEIKYRVDEWPFRKDWSGIGAHGSTHWEVDAYAEYLPYLISIVEELEGQNAKLRQYNERLREQTLRKDKILAEIRQGAEF